MKDEKEIIDAWNKVENFLLEEIEKYGFLMPSGKNKNYESVRLFGDTIKKFIKIERKSNSQTEED